jgi:hypothetical protein
MGFGFGGLEAQFMRLVLVNDICDAFNLPNLFSLEEKFCHNAKVLVKMKIMFSSMLLLLSINA